MLKTILDKVMSGRWIMTTAFTFTACYLAIKGIFPVEAFVGLATLIANSYFNRSDREKEKPSGTGV